MWANLLGATTPHAINAYLPLEAIGGGVTSRIVFVYADGKKKIVIMPSYDEDLKKALLQDLKEIHALVGSFGYTDGY